MTTHPDHDRTPASQAPQLTPEEVAEHERLSAILDEVLRPQPVSRDFVDRILTACEPHLAGLHPTEASDEGAREKGAPVIAGRIGPASWLGLVAGGLAAAMVLVTLGPWQSRPTAPDTVQPVATIDTAVPNLTMLAQDIQQFIQFAYTDHDVVDQRLSMLAIDLDTLAINNDDDWLSRHGLLDDELTVWVTDGDWTDEFWF